MHSRSERYIGHGRLCVCQSVPRRIPTLYCTDPDVTWGMVGGALYIVVHYWADLQSLHGFRCYDNTHVCKCLSALCVPWCKKALYKYSSFPKFIALCTANAYSAERKMSASACTRCMDGFLCSTVPSVSMAYTNLNPGLPTMRLCSHPPLYL